MNSEGLGKKIVFLTPQDGEYGFGLAGVQQVVAGEANAEEILKKTMADPAAGLVVLDERLLAIVTEDRVRELEQGWHGVLLVLPSPEKPPPEAEDYAARLIRRAIGYHVRLNV